MRPLLFLLLALTPFCAYAGDRGRERATANGDYVNGDFKKAATRFAALCNGNDDAEACYWAGLSYERLADERIPFGCTAGTNARRYFSRATRLMPRAPVYRDALFDFLLGASDCSPTALRQAAGVLSATPESDPAYKEMSRRLEDERHYNASAAVRMAKLWLIVTLGYVRDCHCSRLDFKPSRKSSGGGCLRARFSASSRGATTGPRA